MKGRHRIYGDYFSKNSATFQCLPMGIPLDDPALLIRISIEPSFFLFRHCPFWPDLLLVTVNRNPVQLGLHFRYSFEGRSLTFQTNDHLISNSAACPFPSPFLPSPFQAIVPPIIRALFPLKSNRFFIAYLKSVYLDHVHISNKSRFSPAFPRWKYWLVTGTAMDRPRWG